MLNNKYRGSKRYIVCILAIFICILLLGVDIVRYNKAAQEQGKVVTSFNNKQLELNEQKKKQEEEPIKALKIYDGLVISTLGDSITRQGKWQQSVVSELGFSKYSNDGKDGSTVSGMSPNAMWQDVRINEIPKGCNVILFMGGSNDWAQSVPLGNIDNTDINTFFGALKILYSKLVFRFPNSEIVFMSTTFGMLPNHNGFKDKTGLVNNIGLMNIDYGKAIGQFSSVQKIPFIDLTNCGWNKDNIATYVTNDGGGYLHPNKEGANKMAEVIVSRLRAIKSTASK